MILYFLILLLGGLNARSQEVTPFAAGNAGAKHDPYQNLAETLASHVKNPPMSIGVGNFVFGTNVQMSAFSAVLREELEMALARTGKFKVITRSRLAELQDEVKFQQIAAIMEPGLPVPSVSVKGVDGIVRGNFFYKYPDVTIYAELTHLVGGEIRKAKTVVPVKDIKAELWLGGMPSGMQAADIIEPWNARESAANIYDVESRIRKVPQDFVLDLMIGEGKRDFAEGEKISYRVRAAESCHLAVFCHQVDGSTVVLFPNAWCPDTEIQAGEPVRIPGPVKKGFEIVVAPPFGADVVQVIACSRQNSLHTMIRNYVKNAPANVAYRDMPRGMVVKGVEAALVESAPDGSGLPRWSEVHIVICTYPRF